MYLSEVVGQADETAFAGMADQEDQGMEEMKGQEKQEKEGQDERDGDPNDFDHPAYDSALHIHWRYLHRRPVNTANSPMVEVQRLAWSNWFKLFNATKWDHNMNDYYSEIWIYMFPMEWDVLVP